jgi:hypothetical protein
MKMAPNAIWPGAIFATLTNMLGKSLALLSHFQSLPDRSGRQFGFLEHGKNRIAAVYGWPRWRNQFASECLFDGCVYV